MLKKIIVANWKMNPLTTKEAEKIFVSYIKDFKNNVNFKKQNIEIVVCPPVIYISKLREILSQNKKSKNNFVDSFISLGAQNSFWEEVGPFTGEIGTEMLSGLGAKFVILGHSERRELGETNEMINRKIKASLRARLSPILCVGEKERDENHEYYNVVKNQVLECLKGVPKKSFPNISIAYEPVWSISSTPGRRDATPSDALEMSIFIRRIISDLSTPTLASRMRILYGGSVNEKNASEFLGETLTSKDGVDGLLIGKASLDPKKLRSVLDRIIENNKKVKVRP